LPRSACITNPTRYGSPAKVESVELAPRTIHDLGGFPRELYQVQYPAPGDPDLDAHVQKLPAPVQVRHDNRWGLDHGTWSVLRHVYPQADIPVVQLSIDETQPPSFHYEVGKRLALLPCTVFGSTFSFTSAVASECRKL
jgi:aromatic ring-opening dioxygenase catalytic subunit (LigB family)